jgi:hypothetical protein
MVLGEGAAAGLLAGGQLQHAMIATATVVVAAGSSAVALMTCSISDINGLHHT